MRGGRDGAADRCCQRYAAGVLAPPYRFASELRVTQDRQVSLLGELRVTLMGSEVPLPASRKARALLAFLAATGRPHRRERLCELFWDLPDDPKAALRWSLCKLRRVVDARARPRIIADRERVQFDIEDVGIDIRDIHAKLRLQDGHSAVDELEAIARRLDVVLMDGLDGAGDSVRVLAIVRARGRASGTRRGSAAAGHASRHRYGFSAKVAAALARSRPGGCRGARASFTCPCQDEPRRRGDERTRERDWKRRNITTVGQAPRSGGGNQFQGSRPALTANRFLRGPRRNKNSLCDRRVGAAVAEGSQLAQSP